MIETSVAQTIEDRQIEAFVRGADEAMVEARGYGLTTTERDEVEQDAITIYQPSTYHTAPSCWH